MGGNGMKRSLQYGSDTSRIDIMVRESIQNSFDALNDEAEFLDVSYRHGSFMTSDLAKELEGLETPLTIRYPGQQEFIELRDSNTSGLDGPLESSDLDEYGKLIKLVYSIAEKQKGEGKGGSWGYGKTNYYNLGIGLVIYYTNTVYQGAYQQRLVAVLVEDTDHTNDMLLPDFKLGVSYWGSQGDKFPDRAIPVTDTDYIRRFLSVFGIEPFGEKETGTSIIIPFIDRKILLDEMCRDIVPEDVPRDGPDDFKFFVELAVQRWYFPRLLNMGHDRFLRFKFNGELLTDDRMLPLFRILRSLYNKTFTDEAVPVHIGGYALATKTTVAYYASCIENADQFKLPYGMNIYGLLGIERDPSRPNVPIGFRCRSLGMINRYDVGTGIVDNAVATDAGEYTFVGLRPESSVQIINPSNKKPVGRNLEDYIRLGENPSHTTWSDINLKTFGSEFDSFQPRIITSIVTAVARDFTDKSCPEDRTAKRNLGLSKRIGKLFLPSHGYGHSATSAKTPSASCSSGSSSPRTAKMGKTELVRQGSIVVITCPLNLDDGHTRHELGLSSPASEEKQKRSITEWSEKYEMDIPISLQKFELVSVNGESLPQPVVMESPESFFYGQSIFEVEGMNGSLSKLTITHSATVRDMIIKITIDCGKCPFKFNLNITEAE